MAQPETSWLEIYRQGFFIAKRAENLSANTLRQYDQAFGYFAEWLKDGGLPTPTDLRAFFAWLRERPNSRHADQPLSAKTVLNSWITLKSFFHWYADEVGGPNLMDQVPRPKAPEVVIDPLSHAQVQVIVKACEYKREARRENQRPFTMRHPTATRDRALVLFLLDTGVRASELGDLKLEDVDLESGKVVIRKGKGGKGRIVYLGRVGRKALWRYLSKRKAKPADPLFLTSADRPFDRCALRRLLARLGERAGVPNLHPHRLRHTFATEFLRNGGNLLSLQRLLGHATLEMVRKYAAIAEVDLARSHEDGSPVDRWRL